METWKKIEGFENYSVSDQGRVRRDTDYNCTKGGRILKPGKHKRGYLQVALSQNGEVNAKRVHRLVAEAFIPNPDNKPEVNHKNGVNTDNRSENLEWSTTLENMKHAFKTGLNPNSKLTDSAVLQIRQLLTQDLTQKAIGDRFGVSGRAIGDVKLRRSWAHI